MANITFSNIRIAGISACVPRRVEHNMDYDRISEEERKLLIKTTGIAEKRKAPKGVTASDLCFQSAEKLIRELNWKKEEVDALVFVSQSNDYFLPATAIILQNRLGLSKNCLAFDVGLGCSGYVYGLSVVSGLLQSGQIKKALLMAAEASFFSLPYTDKSTYPLFGDAGTVTALEYHPSAPSAYFNLQSDGSGHESIIVYDGYGRNLISDETFKVQQIDKGIERNRIHLVLNGAAIFDFSLREVPPSLKQTAAFANTPLDKIDYFVLHQANLLMNETIRKLMKLPAEKFPYSLREYGNTSSASIPLTIVTQLRQQVTEKSLTLLLSGFGVGLSWGTCILQTNGIVCPELIEYNE